MLCLQELQGATPETIRKELRRTVEQLLTMLNGKTDVLGEMQALNDLLKTLPLPGDAHGVVSKRLGNAHRYLVSQELGAARYELRTLAGSLCYDPPAEQIVTSLPGAELRSHRNAVSRPGISGPEIRPLE